MKKSKTNRFFKVLLCIIISFSFWALNKLSKKEKKNIPVKIKIIDLPENLVLDSISSKKINLKIQGIGSLKTKVKEINISAKKKSNNFLFVNKKEVESQIESHLKIIDIFPDTIFLFTSKKEIKKVPIKHNIEVSLSKNHWMKKPIKIEPDSILIKGNRNELEKILFLETENLKLFDINGKKNGFLLLKKNTFFEEDIELEYTVEAEKYTEGNVKLHIEPINFPSNKEVLLFPKKISLNYLISEEKHNDIKEDDFKIVCDFKNIDISTKHCSITIIKKPKDIKITRINKKIDFLIQ